MRPTETSTLDGASGGGVRLRWLSRAMWVLLAMLFCRILFLIFAEYRHYYPPNFNSDFLLGRADHFGGLYACAFYVHIIASPIALLTAVFLMLTGTNVAMGGRWRPYHRLIGKLQAVLILVLVMPSGIVMSTQANTGWLAGVAFLVLSLATGATVAAAAWFAIQLDIKRHRLWATRCFLLLCSPLLLRLMQGAFIAAGVDSQRTYPWVAWGSWTLLMIGFEFRQCKFVQGILNHGTTA